MENSNLQVQVYNISFIVGTLKLYDESNKVDQHDISEVHRIAALFGIPELEKLCSDYLNSDEDGPDPCSSCDEDNRIKTHMEQICVTDKETADVVFAVNGMFKM